MITQGHSDDERAVAKMLREANEAAGRFRAGDASRDPFDELSALSRGFTAAMARLTDHAADYVAERTARLAAEAQVAQLREVLRLVRVHVQYSSSPTMGLPPSVDARDWAMDGAPEQMARYALQLCIDNSRQARSIIDAALAAASGQCPTCGAKAWEVDGPDATAEGVPSQCANSHQFYAPHAASGVAPDKPAPTECNDERCVLPGAHDLGEFGCLVDPGVAPDQPNGDKR